MCLRSVLGFVVLSKPLGTLWLVDWFLFVILTKGLLLEARISLERRSLIRSELPVWLVRSFESLCFLIWAFTCHVALLIAFEASAFFLVLILLCFCIGTSDLSEYWWINIHWNGLIIGVTSMSIPAWLRLRLCKPHSMWVLHGLSLYEFLLFCLSLGYPIV